MATKLKLTEKHPQGDWDTTRTFNVTELKALDGETIKRARYIQEEGYSEHLVLELENGIEFVFVVHPIECFDMDAEVEFNNIGEVSHGWDRAVKTDE